MKTRALLLALPLLAVSCRENGASVQIQDICHPTTNCQFGATCDEVLTGNPVIDVGLATGNNSLGLFLQVANQTLDSSDEGTYRTNTSDAHVDEIVVEYEGVAIPEQISLTSQRVPAEGTAVVAAVVVPAVSDGAFLTGTGLALLRMRGYFDNGSRFETAEFPIAFSVCSGCGVAACGAGKSVCGSNQGQEPKTCFDPDGAGST